MAAEEFERRFAKGALPSDLSEREIAIPDTGERLTRLMIACGFADSSSSAMRLIDQGSVRIDGAPRRGSLVASCGGQESVCPAGWQAEGDANKACFDQMIDRR